MLCSFLFDDIIIVIYKIILHDYNALVLLV